MPSLGCKPRRYIDRTRRSRRDAIAVFRYFYTGFRGLVDFVGSEAMMVLLMTHTVASDWIWDLWLHEMGSL